MDWDRVTLEFTTSEIQRVIGLLGWSSEKTFTNMNDADRAELARLHAQGYAEMTTLGPEASRAWWDAHVVERVPYRTLAAVPALED
jgi:hypothetical protein